MFYFGMVGTVVTLAGHPVLAPLRWWPLCYLGLISYGIYLYHWPVYWVLDGYESRREVFFWHGVFKVSVTLIVAIASWHLIERPLLSLKDRFRYDANQEGEPKARATTAPSDGRPSRIPRCDTG